MLCNTEVDKGITMSRMTTKGQVTIPKRIRDYLGLKPGAEIAFECASNGRVLLKTDGMRPASRFAGLSVRE